MKNNEDNNQEEQNDKPVGNPYPDKQAGIVNEFIEPAQEQNGQRKANRISDSGTRDDDGNGADAEIEDNYGGA